MDLRDEPTPVNATTHATDTRAAIRPYSMAVVPNSSVTSSWTIRNIWPAPERVGLGKREAPAQAGPNARLTYGPTALLRVVETLVKIAFNDVPTLVRATIAATDTSAAMRPYSMAVVPDSSLASCSRVCIARAPLV